MEAITEARVYNPALHVFGIPELAKLICERMSRQENTRLLCVCHQLFQDIRGFVWERMNTIEPIVQIILEASEDAYIDEAFLSKTVHLPTSPNLSRLQLYAPYVKQLDIPLESMFDVYLNWDGFLASTQRIELLPNLEHLRLVVPQHGYRPIISINEETLNWIVAFLSPSLLSIQLFQDVTWEVDLNKVLHAWIDPGSATQLLQQLSEKCHHLSSLMFLAGVSPSPEPRMWDDVQEPLPYLTFSKPTLGLDSIIPRFHCLRKLSTTPFVLDPKAFKALGELPLLEELSIRDAQRRLTRNWRGFTFELDVPDDAFPALRHLDLLDFSYDAIINICKQRQLALALHSLKPDITGYDTEENKHDQLLRILAEHNSSVRQLCLARIPLGWELFPQSAGYLSCLKLTHLSIPQSSRWGSDDDLSQLNSAVPGLKSLALIDLSSRFPYHFPLKVLRRIVERLPNLNRLSIPLDFASAEELGEQDFTPHAFQSFEPFCLESCFGGVGTPYWYASDDPSALAKYIKEIARYLHALWPNIECKIINFSHSDEGSDSSDLIRLNSILSQLNIQESGY